MSNEMDAGPYWGNSNVPIRNEPPIREALVKNAESVTYKGHDYQLETERRMGARQQRIIEELRAALEKHHWPELVPGDGPCPVCGLDASVAY